MISTEAKLYSVCNTYNSSGDQHLCNTVPVFETLVTCNSNSSGGLQLCMTLPVFATLTLVSSNSSGAQHLCMTVPVFATAGATGVPGACTELALLCGNDTALSL